MGAFDPRWFLFSLLGTLTSGLQNLLRWGVNSVLEHLFSKIEIANDSAIFDYTLQWIQTHPNAAQFKSLSIERVDYEDLPAAKTRGFDFHPVDDFVVRRSSRKPSPILGISSGNHFLWHKKRPVWIHKTKIQDTNFAANVTPREVITLKTLGKNPSFIKELLQEIIDLAYKTAKQVVEVRTSAMGNWGYPCTRKPRPPDSVILPKGVLEGLLEDCKWFLDSEEWYQSLSIPYRRGYLLHGDPGTGKSITVHAIATEVKANIWCITIGDPNLNDTYLFSLLQTVPSGDIILFEDIDRIKVTNKDSEEAQPDLPTTMNWAGPRGGITLSGLLNALDGLASQTGRLIFMTTNHKDKLDPALIRPGRIDYQQEFSLADYDQARNFFIRFFPEVDSTLTEEFSVLAASQQIAMAELQQILLAHRRNPRLVIEELGKRAS